MTRILSICLAAGCLFLTACDEPFEPKGPFEERLVVYGLLSTLTDTQYVRVYTTYNPDGFDPFTNVNDKQVGGATISLVSAQGTLLYRDTAITRADQSRYTSDISPYILTPYRPTPGATYRLDVQLPSGKTASGTVSVPDRGSVSVSTVHIVEAPGSYTEDVRLEARISAKTRGLLVRMYIEFEVSQGAVTELKRVEVPSRVRGFGESEIVEATYPTLQRRVSTSSGNLERIEFITFQREAYLTLLADFATAYSGWNIKRKRAYFVLWQAEPNLYNYYNIVNGFRDEISIRTDEPDFTAMDGALGIFGAMTVDTTFYTYRPQ